MERFGGFKDREVLGDEILQSPKNAFTASSFPHQLFDELRIWLTPVKACLLDTTTYNGTESLSGPRDRSRHT